MWGWASSQLSLGRVNERGKRKTGPGGEGRGCTRLESVFGFSEEYARKEGAGGIKVDENLPSELERPINEPAGFMKLLYAK